jgi:hypothetical protein
MAREEYLVWYELHCRGVAICERWNNYCDFLDDMGPRPRNQTGKLILELIDNRSSYRPGNCRWAVYRPRRIQVRKSTT